MIKIAPRLALASSAALLCASLLACEDPSTSVSPASVGSAKPATTAKATATTTTTAATTATGSASAAPGASAAAVALPDKPAGAITLAPPKSKIEWTGSKVTGKHEGSFQQFDGWIAITDDKPESAKIAVVIDMTSVKSDDDKLTGHLKSGDFFEVEKFPKASFTSTEIKAGGDKGATHTITGNLNLRGVEKSVTFPATIKVTADKVTAKSEFSINRKDWGIVYAGKADDLIRDGVVIKLDLSADRPKK
ncbi:MAG: YceI family protein [Polyangiaceae bacterium]